MTQIRIEQQARQQLSLTPKQQQSVKLLQMSTLELSHEVNTAIANNPFLEEPDETWTDHGAQEEDTHVGTNNDTDRHHDGHTPSEGSASDSGDPPGNAQEQVMPDMPAAYSGDYPRHRNTDQGASDVGVWAHSVISLQDSLLADLCGYALNERDRKLAEHIIEAIDDDGYLRTPFCELADAGQFDPDVGNDEWEIALRLVQQLGAPGLGARHLIECMTLQLDALPATTPHKKLALLIVSEHLDKLGRNDTPGLAHVLRSTEHEIQAASTLIRSLEPRPGNRHSPVDPSTYIVPDVIVRKAGMQWIAVSNEAAIPQARLNATYARMFQGTRYSGRTLMAKELQEARWLLRSLEQRGNTIQRVAEAIIARQQTFFDYGEIALRPLMLSEIATELEIHESTVSRATSNKYLASPRGIFEFKHFFSRELPTQSGGTCSAGAVRALIQEMIGDEDPKSPLSDVVLTHKLEREGIVVARRTVSKYRAQIKIPPAELRRAF